MSAITWKQLPSFHDAPLCEGACRTLKDTRSIGVWRLEILGWPAGCWCAACRRQMSRAWNSAVSL